MEDEKLDEIQLYFLNSWEQAFAALLGSRPDEVRAWARHLRQWNPFIEREGPMYYVGWALYAKLLWRRVGDEARVRVIRELGNQIYDAGLKDPLLTENFDWKAAKKRVEDYLEQWGTSLSQFKGNIPRRGELSIEDTQEEHDK